MTSLNDWPHSVLHGIPADDAHSVVAQLFCNLSSREIPSAEVVSTQLRSEVIPAQLDSTTLRVLTLSGSTFPAVAIDVSDKDAKVLQQFLNQRLGSRCVLHPASRHVVVCIGADAMVPKAARLFRRLLESCSHTAVFLFIADALGRVPNLLRERCLVMNLRLPMVAGGPAADNNRSISAIIDAFSTTSHMERIAKAMTAETPVRLLRALAALSPEHAALAATADIMLSKSQSWSSVARYVAMHAPDLSSARD
jgi:hypothetical protein